jgi:pilus assembly protein Flp/PilA
MKRLRTESATPVETATPFLIRLQQKAGRRGAVAVEYVLLITVVGIGALVGLASVRDALVNELDDLATAIMAIT